MADHTVRIYSIDLEPSPSDVGACRRLLNEEEATFARRFESTIERNRWVVSRGMLRNILAKECDTQADKIEFNQGIGASKRTLVGSCASSGIHFSLAKANDLALVAVTKVAPLGIDIEYMRALQDPETIATYFMNARELEKFLQLSDHQKTEAFYSTLTRKEAIIKASGVVGNNPFTSLEVTMTDEGPARILSVENDDSEKIDWQLVHIGLFTKYTGALAVCTSTPVVINYVSQDQIFQPTNPNSTPH